jgi:hypothetical protein
MAMSSCVGTEWRARMLASTIKFQKSSWGCTTLPRYEGNDYAKGTVVLYSKEKVSQMLLT